MKILAIILNVLLLIALILVILTKAPLQSGIDEVFFFFTFILSIINLLAQRKVAGMRVLAIILNVSFLIMIITLSVGMKELSDGSKMLLFLLILIFPVINLLALQTLPRINNPLKNLLARANTQTKRLALLVFPFFAIITLYRWMQDLDHYEWPSLSFLLFAMASALCLLIAFTRLGDWLHSK